jgi:hypothetical protein
LYTVAPVKLLGRIVRSCVEFTATAGLDDVERSTDVFAATTVVAILPVHDPRVALMP